MKEEILFCCEPEETTNIEDCDNKGCGFNVEGKCKASGTGCYGYIEPVTTNKL